jgi:hypothetical protein
MVTQVSVTGRGASGRARGDGGTATTAAAAAVYICPPVIDDCRWYQPGNIMVTREHTSLGLRDTGTRINTSGLGFCLCTIASQTLSPNKQLTGFGLGEAGAGLGSSGLGDGLAAAMQAPLITQPASVQTALGRPLQQQQQQQQQLQQQQQQ